MEDVIKDLKTAQTKQYSCHSEPEEASHSQLHEHEDYSPSASTEHSLLRHSQLQELKDYSPFPSTEHSPLPSPGHSPQWSPNNNPKHARIGSPSQCGAPHPLPPPLQFSFGREGQYYSKGGDQHAQFNSQSLNWYPESAVPNARNSTTQCS